MDPLELKFEVIATRSTRGRPWLAQVRLGGVTVWRCDESRDSTQAEAASDAGRRFAMKLARAIEVA